MNSPARQQQQPVSEHRQDDSELNFVYLIRSSACIHGAWTMSLLRRARPRVVNTDAGSDSFC